MHLLEMLKPNKLSLVISFILCFTITSLAQIVVGPGSGGSGGSGSIVGGTCTNQAVTAIDTTGVPTCTTLTSAYVNSSIIINGGALGTPSSGTLTNATGLPIAGITGLGAGVATWLATPSSANLASAVTGETGSGGLVFADSPTISRWAWTAATGVMTATSDAGTGSSQFNWNPGGSNTTMDLRRTDGDTFFRISDLSENRLFQIRYGVTGTPQFAQILYDDEVAGHLPAITFRQSTSDTVEQISINAHNGSSTGGWSLFRNGNGLFSGPLFDLAAAGVRFSASDGVLTLLGLGNGNDENLTFDFDNAAANTVAVGTGTGVTKIDFGTIILEGAFSSSDGTAGVTVTTCTSFKDGLCVAGT